MAQNPKYVAELLLSLKANSALTDARKAINTLLGDAQQAEAGLEKMLQSLQGKYGIELDVDINAEDIDKELEMVRRKLNVASSSNNLNIGFGEARADVAALKGEILAAAQAEEVLNDGVRELADAQEKATDAAVKYGQAAKAAGQSAAQGHVKTTLAAQNVVRIIQDLPFGMMGITNNIQALADSMVYLRGQVIYTNKETGKYVTQIDAAQKATGLWTEGTLSFGQAARATVKSLLFGPMAFTLLIAVITSLVLRWDEMAGMIDKVKMKLGLLTREQNLYNQALRDLKAAQEDLQYDEIKGVLNELPTGELMKVRDGVVETNKALADQEDMWRNKITPAMQEAYDRSQSGNFEFQWKPGSMFSRTVLTEAEKALAAEYEKYQENADNFARQIEENNARAMTANAIFGERLRKQGVKMWAEVMGASFETAKEESKKFAGLWFNIRQMQIDQMEDSRDKIVEQVELDFDEMRAGFEKNAPGYQQAIAESYRAQAHAEREALEEYADEVRQEQEKVIAQEQKVAETRIALRRTNADIRDGQIRDEEARRRAEIDTEARFTEEELTSERDALIAKRALWDTTAEEYVEYTAQIMLLSRQIVQARQEAEQETIASWEREAEAQGRLVRQKIDIMRELQVESDRLREMQARSSQGGPLDLFGAFDAIAATRSNREADSADTLRDRLAEIRDNFGSLDEGEGKRQAETAAQQHEDRMAQIEQDSMQERLDAKRAFWNSAAGVANDVLSNISQAATMNYETWRTERERELDEMGVSEEQKAEIIKKEGKKQFEQQKKLQEAAVWVQGLTGAVSAIASVAHLGPAGWAIGGIQAAAIMALTAANARRIRAMQPGGGGGGGGAGGGFATGNYTALNAVVAADRVSGFETWRLTGGFGSDPFAGTADRMNQAVDRFEQSAANLTAVVEPRAQGQIVRNGRNFNDLTNGNA